MNPETMSSRNTPTTIPTPPEMQPRTRIPSPAHTPASLLPFLNNPDFKRLVAQQVDFICKQAVKSGRIRVIRQNPTPVFIPRMDIVDDPSCPRFVATFELPGVKFNEVALRIHEGSLVVDGERRLRLRTQLGTSQSSETPSTQNASLDQKVRIPIQELRYGRFHRVIALPIGTKSADITARFQDGMLIVTWPRSPTADVDVEMAPAPHPDSTTTPINSPPSIKQEVA